MPVSEKLYGVDLLANEAAYILLNVKKGINILVGGVDKLIEINKKADLIIISHVLAHVNDFNRFISDVKKILKSKNRIKCAPPAPPYGLYLTDIRY